MEFQLLHSKFLSFLLILSIGSISLLELLKLELGSQVIGSLTFEEPTQGSSNSLIFRDLLAGDQNITLSSSYKELEEDRNKKESTEFRYKKKAVDFGSYDEWDQSGAAHPRHAQKVMENGNSTRNQTCPDSTEARMLISKAKEVKFWLGFELPNNTFHLQPRLFPPVELRPCLSKAEFSFYTPHYFNKSMPTLPDPEISLVNGTQLPNGTFTFLVDKTRFKKKVEYVLKITFESKVKEVGPN